MISKDPNLKTEKEIVACSLVHDGRILYVKRNPKKPQGGLWGCPGGKKEDGEDSVTTAKREIREETGIDLSGIDLEYINTWKVVFNNHKKGCTYNSFSYCLYRVVFDKRPMVVLRNKELVDYGWFTPEEALQLPLVEDEDGVVRDVWGL